MSVNRTVETLWTLIVIETISEIRNIGGEQSPTSNLVGLSAAVPSKSPPMPSGDASTHRLEAVGRVNSQQLGSTPQGRRRSEVMVLPVSDGGVLAGATTTTIGSGAWWR